MPQFSIAESIVPAISITPKQNFAGNDYVPIAVELSAFFGSWKARKELKKERRGEFGVKGNLRSGEGLVLETFQEKEEKRKVWIGGNRRQRFPMHFLAV
ncbi:hypothetical protein EYC84_003517 [Monilinia fructicola]|uniref:Uncharacterized protein n=1 Tax=Monilinia fructicola TaxID=38448 RepID=A0A5M9JUS9_MONFR|nr:hypothetical protein EYC84_003517 [Monilinia fructicola]